MEPARPAWSGCREQFAAAPGAWDRAARVVARAAPLALVPLRVSRLRGIVMPGAQAPWLVVTLGAQPVWLVVMLGARAARFAEQRVGAH